MIRLPVTSIVAEWLRGLPAIAGMFVLVVFVASQRESTLGPWVQVVACGLIGLRLLMPVYLWATTLLAVGERGISVTSGVLRARRDSIAWRDISVLEVDQPWSHRICGLSVVKLRPAGDIESQITLDGADRPLLDRLCEGVDNARGTGGKLGVQAPSETVLGAAGDPVAPVESPDEEAYRATWRDLLVTCVVQGRVLVVASGVAVGGYDLLSDLSVADDATAWLRADPVTAAVVFGLLATSATAVAVIVRYGGMVVRRRGNGLLLQHGLLDRVARVVTGEALVGVSVTRNLLEMITDRVRVSLITSDGVGGLGQNLVLPSLPRAAARRAVAVLDPDLVRFRILDSKGIAGAPRAAGMLALGLAVSIASWCGVMAWTSTPWLALAAVVAIIAVGIGAARLLCTCFGATPTVVEVCRCTTVDREERVRSDQLHLMRVTSAWPQRLRLVKVTFFAGMPRHRVGLVANGGVADGIESAMKAAASARDTGRRSRHPDSTKGDR